MNVQTLRNRHATRANADYKSLSSIYSDCKSEWTSCNAANANANANAHAPVSTLTRSRMYAPVREIRYFLLILLMALAPAAAIVAQDECEITLTGTSYATIADALAAVGSGQARTIRLLKDATHNGNMTINDSRKVTFDLDNQYTLTVNNTSGVALSVNGNGSVDLIKDAGPAAFNVNGGSRGVFANNGNARVTNATATGTNGYGVYATTGSQVTVTGNATGTVYGVNAYGSGSVITVGGDAIATDPGTTMMPSSGAYASSNGGKVTVNGNALGVDYGVSASGAGSEVTVTGNVTATGNQSWNYGAYAGSGGKITIDGKINFTSPAVYIRTGSANKAPAQFEPVTTLAGYATYTDNGTNTVWVKAPVITIDAQPDPFTALPEGYAGGSVLTVSASVVPADATLAYQWYENTTASTSGSVAISGATAATFNIPSNVTAGVNYYYYCVVSASGGMSSATSDFAVAGIVTCRVIDASNAVVGSYTPLTEALAAVGDGQTIRLLTHITHPYGIAISGKSITIDLDNQYTLTVNNTTGTALSVTGNGSAVKLINAPKGVAEFNVNGSTRGVYADSNGLAEVTNASTSNGVGAYALNGGKITLIGNAEGSSYGTYATGANSEITAGGDVKATGASSRGAFAQNNGKVSVTGNATATGTGSYGASASGGGNITVGGNAEAAGTDSRGASADGSTSTVTVTGNATATGTGSYGVRAASGSKINVTLNVTGVQYGAYANGSGTEIAVGGNVTATDNTSTTTGAYAVFGGNITIDGSISVQPGARYIYVEVSKTPADITLPTTKAGYATYSDVLNGTTVWVKAPASAAVISIGTHPAPTTAFAVGAISGSSSVLTVAASVTPADATLTYQWYLNSAASTSGGTAITGATGATFTLPATLAAGVYYYYCVVNANGNAATATSGLATVTIAVCEILDASNTVIGSYTTLADALSAHADGQTIRLLTDVTHPGGITVTGRTVIFDLDSQYTLTVNNASGTALTVSGAGTAVALKNALAGTAEFNVNGLTRGVSASGGSIAEVSGATASDNNGYAVHASGGAQVTVGGNAQATSASTLSSALGYGVYAVDGGTKVTVGGNATSATATGYGARAVSGAEITVHGNAAAAGNTGIGAYANSFTSKVTVGGDAKGGMIGAQTLDANTEITVGGDAIGTGTLSIGTFSDGGKITVTGKAQGMLNGVYANGAGGVVTVITVGGNVESTAATGCGVRAIGGDASVTVGGSVKGVLYGIYAAGTGTLVTVAGTVAATDAAGVGIEAGNNAKAIIEGSITVPATATYVNAGGMIKTSTDVTTPSTLAGYLEYSDGGSYVWVKNSVPPPTVPPTITSAGSYSTVSGAGGTFQVVATGTATITYSLTGVPAGVSINPATGLMTIATSTAAGTHSFTVTAANGGGSDSQPFTLTVTAPAIPSTTAPGAPTAVSATAGNGQVTVTFTAPANNGGSPITAYTVTSSPDGITASGASSPITVTGLTNGVAYTFTVTATNSAGTGASSSASGSVTPTATPQPAAYAVAVVPATGGSVTANKTSATAGETVALTLAPNADYDLTSLTVCMTGDPTTTVPTSGTGNNRTFTMPAFDVTVTATFQKNDLQSVWQQVKALIESAAYTVPQSSANTAAGLQYALAAIINDLISKDPTLAALGFTVSASDIVVYSFTPATSGDSVLPAGTNGVFDFRVSPPNLNNSAYATGVITASPVGNESLRASSLRAWTIDGTLHVSGLTAGETWRVHNLAGTLIYQGIAANGGEAKQPLPARGIYIVTGGKAVIKVIN